MQYISLFSGIEAATVAWEPLGWEALAFSEVEPFCCKLLAERYPDVPNLGDIRDIDWGGVIERVGRPDVIVGGSPCQSFSLAGDRSSLDGESRLMFEYIRALREVRPRWFLWENVPGALSAKGQDGKPGGAFGLLLDQVDELGYDCAWRVLDAQFFGVAQRRRRVFLVGCLGGGGRAAAVLFDSESVPRDSQSSRKKREELAAASGRSVAASGGSGCFKVRCGTDTYVKPDGKIGSGGKGPLVSDECSFTVAAMQDQYVYCMATGQGRAEILDNHSPCLSCNHEQPTAFYGK